MLWEGNVAGFEVPFEWSIWENGKRKDEFYNSVFPMYLRHYMSKESERDGIWHGYEIEGTMLLCSDSRPNPNKFSLLDGELFVKRGVGTKFSVGNHLFRQTISRSIEKTLGTKRKHIICVTYHYCSVDPSKSCAGQKHNKAVATRYAIEFAKKLRNNIWYEDVFIIIVGIDTGTGNATFHGYNGEFLDINSMSEPTPDLFLFETHKLYHGWPIKVRRYIAERLMMGNWVYQQKHGGEKKPSVSLDHHEIVWGPGFGYFPFPKHRVFVHNPFIMDPTEWRDGLNVIRSNLKKDDQGRSRIENGFIMSASAMYREEKEKQWAIDEARYLHNIAKKYIKDSFPDLYGVMDVMPIVVSRETMEVTPLEL